MTSIRRRAFSRSRIRSTRRAVSRSSTARSLRREASSFSSGHLREISGDIRGDRNAESSRSIIHRNALSWGIKEFAATLYRDLPALRIKVNGRLHAGYVIVALNGSDYYEVYLVKGMEVECVNEEVCFDELGDVIDRAIESGTNKAEYDKFCEQERQKLFGEAV